MADVTDQRVIDFCNKRCRTIADLAVRLRYVVDAWKADYASEGIATLVGGNAGTDVILDGAGPDGDGRTVVTVSDLLILSNALDTVQAGIESVPVAGAGGQFAFPFLNKWQVNGSIF